LKIAKQSVSAGRTRVKRLLVANRGEVASRVIRGAAECGITPIAIFSTDDAGAPFCGMAEAIALPGAGPAAYLDIAAVIAAARAARADALHPGWGFLSESPALARACAAAGIRFVGPPAELLALFGDKLRARALAVASGVPVAETAATLQGARELLAQGPVMVKAAAGGGGRGMRLARDLTGLEAAWRDGAAEAQAAFGDGTVYAERYISRARHVEIQIAGDGLESRALGSRECSLQRRHQKLVEFAPANVPMLGALTEAALRMARAANYAGLGTWEFLVAGPEFWFLEVNPRLQVEHTVTEAVTGLDLVHLQLHLAAGDRLAALNLPSPMPVNGVAMQLRLNAERMDQHGDVWPSAGTITRLALPAGPGIRVDHALGVGYAPALAFDSLLAKLIIHAPARDMLFRRAARALRDVELAGLRTNIALLTRLIGMGAVAADEIDTGFIERHAASLGETAPAAEASGEAIPAGLIALAAPMTGQLVALTVAVGDEIRPGQTAGLVEAMKMQVALSPAAPGRVTALLAEPGATVQQGQPILLIEPISGAAGADEQAAHDPDAIRPDLAELLQRRRATADEARPEAIARRHEQGKRSIRENLDALLDLGSFIEYGALGVAAQRRRRSLEDLIRLTPADGLISGIGKVDGRDVAVLAYDYTVLAGTQGFIGHKKTDRLLALALANRLPLVLFAEGGGGRPGDSDFSGVAGLDLPTFGRFARLSGRVPVVGIVAGNCFAGNAALLGCCDAIIATPDASIGMGGPAMIEGGGLGVFRAEEVGPAAVQSANGVIDILVADEAEAVATAKRYLAYFTVQKTGFAAADQRLLRNAVPENRKRAYDMRALIETLADDDSVLELRRGFAPGMITAFVRVEGRPMGLIANNPMHLGGAIDAVGADKAARFMRLCNAHGLPILSLCDTPGFMVGPDTERTAQVRHVCRMFVTGAALRVPLFCIVPRKGYGLGAMAMAGGGFHETVFTAAWPSGEFGGMGLEGAVRLGYKRELDAAPDDAARQALFETLVAKLYAEGKAINMASYLEIDACIDPVETRAWISSGLRAAKPVSPDYAGFIDTW
jgi:acetyl-CoA carboxylase carboxyltransferase component/acetyl/propionyl-CoA carboxylase alpha subunit